MNIQVSKGAHNGKPCLKFWDLDAKAPNGPRLTLDVETAQIISSHMQEIADFLKGER